MSVSRPPIASKAAPRQVIELLRAQIQHFEGHSAGEPQLLPFGLKAIDKHLPNGGLMLGSLHEVSGGKGDIAHGAAGALFIAGILARLKGPVLWCVNRPDLFAPGLASVGLHPDRVIYSETGKTKNVLLVMEEGLKYSGLAGVVGEVDKLTLTASRRLHLAAQSSGVVAFALRRWLTFADVEKADATASNTRWRITAKGSVPLSTPGIGRALWQLELLRCRNGNPATFIVEACNANGQLSAYRLSSPALLAERPAAAEVGRRYIST